jgi:hypothetical protein
MRPERYSADSLAALLRRKTIATMPELMAALGTSVERTVFRKLAGLRCRASYTHRGRYYVLDETARFDSLGLWSFRSVWFSAHGTLVETASALVNASRAGYFVAELDELLHVCTKDCLRHLAAHGRVAREQVRGRHLSCSADPVKRRVQLAARHALLGPAGGPAVRPVTDELKATIVLFLGVLDEQQRRLFAGLESLQLGPGGDAVVAQLLGLDPATVAKGRQALLRQEIDQARVRRAGGGRPAVEKKRPRSSRASKSS